MTAPGAILTLNAGSSSLKFALFAGEATPGADLSVLLRGEIETSGTGSHFRARTAAGDLIDHDVESGDAALSVPRDLLAFVEANLGRHRLAAVGHRVVHGGATHIAPERVTPALLADLQELIPLDPLHMRDNLAPIQALLETRPALPQVACFDTAFHHTLPPLARLFAIPRALSAAGIRRYGFHGLSYEYIARRLARAASHRASGRVVVAHLGSGASLCAMRDGISIATTFGFSALDGLVMATRCGSIDPGVLLYLGRQGRSFAEIEALLYHQSGLLGVSGISGDVRVLLASDDPHAAEAIALFVYRVAAEAAAMVCALGGIDSFVFTGGIGAHANAIRGAICDSLAWLGLRLDRPANAAHASLISTAASAVEILVMPTDEEQMIARHTRAAVDIVSIAAAHA